MAKGKGKKSAGMKGQMIMIFMIIVSVVFLPTSVMLFIGMMPTLVAIVADRSRKKTKAVTVGAMNLAGCAPFLLRLLEQGHDLRNALEIVSDP
ncbi:MAG: hypothetical protein IT558_03070, partial [Alphaproteobacteria bacterium]|nr:hypothetical protein [Alphaproteobacteria bacterium]